MPDSRRRHCWNHRYDGWPAGRATGCIVSELTVVSCGSLENHEVWPEVAFAATSGNTVSFGARTQVVPASKPAVGVPFSLSKSTCTLPVPFGQVIGASGGCGAREGVERSSVASVAWWTLRQSAVVRPAVVAGQVLAAAVEHAGQVAVVAAGDQVLDHVEVEGRGLLQRTAVDPVMVWPVELPPCEIR